LVFGFGFWFLIFDWESLRIPENPWESQAIPVKITKTKNQKPKTKFHFSKTKSQNQKPKTKNQKPKFTFQNQKPKTKSQVLIM
jgi:hypothetical protein